MCAVNVKLQSFLEVHANNLAQYRASTELLVKQGYDPQQADQAVKGIDLLTLLDEAMAGEGADRWQADRQGAPSSRR